MGSCWWEDCEGGGMRGKEGVRMVIEGCVYRMKKDIAGER
eukprot:COSAG01_NODE_7132_length_3336_cov_3.598703_5_plen_40_part_00